MEKHNLLIAAAGNGSRAGLNYPKCLYEIDGVPIIIRILRTTEDFTDNVTVVVSEKGKKAIEDCLNHWQFSVEYIIQLEAKGMGDAVLTYYKSTFFDTTKDTLLFWGDLPFVEKSTIKKLINLHASEEAHFSLPTVEVSNPYTLVKRDVNENFLRIIETKDLKIELPSYGERDIGVFLFDHKLVLKLLKLPNRNKFGISKNGEHGFLYVCEILRELGYIIRAHKIASKREARSLNYLSDIER